MKQVTNLEDLAGKTIKGHIVGVDEEAIVLTFNDNTFLYIQSTGDYLGWDWDWTGRDFDVLDLHSAGLVSDSEYLKMTRLASEKAEQERLKSEAYERATYEKLKAKFEPGS